MMSHSAFGGFLPARWSRWGENLGRQPWERSRFLPSPQRALCLPEGRQQPKVDPWHVPGGRRRGTGRWEPRCRPQRSQECRRRLHPEVEPSTLTWTVVVLVVGFLSPPTTIIQWFYDWAFSQLNPWNGWKTKRRRLLFMWGLNSVLLCVTVLFCSWSTRSVYVKWVRPQRWKHIQKIQTYSLICALDINPTVGLSCGRGLSYGRGYVMGGFWNTGWSCYGRGLFCGRGCYRRGRPVGGVIGFEQP